MSKFELLPPDATGEQLQTKLSQLPPRLVKKVAKLLGKRDVRRKAKPENILFVTQQPLIAAVEITNMVVELRNVRFNKVAKAMLTIITIGQQAVNVRSREQAVQWIKEQLNRLEDDADDA